MSSRPPCCCPPWTTTARSTTCTPRPSPVPSQRGLPTPARDCPRVPSSRSRQWLSSRTPPVRPRVHRYCRLSACRRSPVPSSSVPRLACVLACKGSAPVVPLTARHPTKVIPLPTPSLLCWRVYRKPPFSHLGTVKGLLAQLDVDLVVCSAHPLLQRIPRAHLKWMSLQVVSKVGRTMTTREGTRHPMYQRLDTRGSLGTAILGKGRSDRMQQGPGGRTDGRERDGVWCRGRGWCRSTRPFASKYISVLHCITRYTVFGTTIRTVTST
mmetsp:Transcript_13443/g.42357  ORF Transcript_13443/g.42357 Transcript_13443/m.42357 type:complete len:268 (+) Transcript_13443:295-1098(+)